MASTRQIASNLAWAALWVGCNSGMAPGPVGGVSDTHSEAHGDTGRPPMSAVDTMPDVEGHESEIVADAAIQGLLDPRADLRSTTSDARFASNRPDGELAGLDVPASEDPSDATVVALDVADGETTSSDSDVADSDSVANKPMDAVPLDGADISVLLSDTSAFDAGKLAPVDDGTGPVDPVDENSGQDDAIPVDDGGEAATATVADDVPVALEDVAVAATAPDDAASEPITDDGGPANDPGTESKPPLPLGPEWVVSFGTGQVITSSIGVDAKAGVLYVTTATDFATGYPSFLHALDAATGAEFWKAKFSGAGAVVPVVSDDGSVVLVTTTPSYPLGLDGHAKVLRVTPSGEIQWKEPFLTTKPFLRSLCPAVSEDGRIYYVIDEKMVATSPDDGSFLWETTIDSNPASTCSYETGCEKTPHNWWSLSPALHDGRLYLVDGDMKLDVLDADTGEVLLAKPLEGAEYLCPPAIAPDGSIVIGTKMWHEPNYGLGALDALTGETLWKTALLPMGGCVAIGGDGMVYGNSGYPFAVSSAGVLWQKSDYDIGGALGTVLGLTIGISLSGTDKVLVSFTSGLSAYALLSTAGEVLEAPQLGVVPKWKTIYDTTPPAVIPAPGQIVFVTVAKSELSSTFESLVVSVPAPVAMPPQGVWATMHANQRNNRRVP